MGILKKMIFTVMVGLCIGHNLHSQDLIRSIHGVVTDAQTFKPIPYVYVFTSVDGTVTTFEGLFSIMAQNKDIINFSHIGYNQSAFQLASDLTDSVRVILIPRKRILDEVVIHDYPTLDFLKKQVLEIRVIPTVEEINAENNMVNSKMIYLSGYRPNMNDYDNYRAFMEGPQEVSFFSTNPSKGLLRDLKNFSKKRSALRLRPAYYSPLTDSLWLNQTILKRDSIQKQN